MAGDANSTLNHLFFEHVASRRCERLLSWESMGGMAVYSSERLVRAVLGLHDFLGSLGLAADGERIAIFSENRPEWHIADFAILLSRHIVVPIYPTLSPAQIEYQLRHSGCRAIVISGSPQWQIIEPMLSRLADLQWIMGMDDCLPANPPHGRTCIPLGRIEAEAREPDATRFAKIRGECLAADPSAIATIVYTSGTTGTPKGVMLSHRNIAFDLEGCLGRLGFRTARQALSVLPLAHVFERLLCYGYFRMGVPIAYGDPHQLRYLLRLHRPEVMGCVPRILEKTRDAIEDQVEALAPWKRVVARRLLRADPERPRRAAFSAGALLDRFLAARVRGKLGGLRYFICGGAWLDPALERFFRGAGFEVLQGYGMTETSPVICLNELGHEKPGSVGRPLEQVEVRIGDDGEIRTRGPHVMAGYYNEPEATGQAFHEGWLLTGDLGRLDEDGFLAITGRRKDMLVLSNGKKVCCASLEKALARSRFIQDAFVVGEGRNFTSALIVPHSENLVRAARERAVSFQSEDDLLLAPPVIELFRREMETYQAEFANFEQVKRFCFLNAEALADPELTTPTQKMRRGALERKYAAWIGQLYARQEPFLIPRIEQDGGSVPRERMAIK